MVNNVSVFVTRLVSYMCKCVIKKCLHTFDLQEAQDLYDMLLSRLSLQRRAYKHKTVRLIEKM